MSREGGIGRFCAGCPLEQQSDPISARGPSTAKYLIVTDTPSATNAGNNRLLSRSAMAVLGSALTGAGFAKEDFAFAPAVRCPHDADTFTTKQKREIAACCRGYLIDEVKKRRPQAVLPLGAEAAKQVFGRAVKITKVRGQATFEAEMRGQVFPLVNPAQCVMYPQHEPILRADCMTFGRMVDHAFDKKSASDALLGNYEFVDDLQFLVDAAPPILAFDTENTGLRWFQEGTDVREYDPAIHKGNPDYKPAAAVLTMQFCTEPGKAYMLVWDHPERPRSYRSKARLREQLRALLNNPKTKVVGQNCVTADTEVLTPEGWVAIAEYDKQEVMQWDSRDGSMSFVRPSAFHVSPFEGEMLLWEGHALNQCVTPNHRMPIAKASHREVYAFVPALEAGKHDPNNTYIPTAGMYAPEDALKVDAAGARLIEAVRADGHVYRRSGKSLWRVEWHFSKKRKVDRLLQLLQDNSVPYSIATTRTGSTKIRTRTSDRVHELCSLLGGSKTYGSWVLRLSIEARTALLDEVKHWDGNLHSGSASGVAVYSAVKENMIWLQVAAHVTGGRMSYSRKPNNRGWSKKDGVLYVGTLNMARRSAKLQTDGVATAYTGNVYCFTVPTGAFLVRRGGVVSVTGNSKYDRVYMRNVEGIDYPISGDTLMLGVLLDENAMEKNQDVLVKRYVPERAGYADSFSATTDKSRMWEVPLDKLLDYGAGDAETCFMLHERLYSEVSSDSKLLAHYNRVSIPGNNVFSLIESAGLHIDFEALNSFQAHMVEHVDNLERSLLEQVPKSIKRKHVDKGLKFSRKDFLLDILFWHPDGFRLQPMVFTKTTAKLPVEMRVPSTSAKDHLPFFFDSCPFTVMLSQYIKDSRLLGTSILKFREKYIVDGMVRPTYSLATAVTGRTNSYDPNGQNYPKRGANATAYRRMMVPPPGHLVIEADLSQAELRIAAEMAGEPTMLRVYRDGGDIHIETALIILGVSLAEFKKLPKAAQKAARQKAKAVNFGLIYGMWWRKLILYAKTQYNVEFTDNEAKRIREAFFDKYAALGAWHDSAKAFARKHKYVRSLDGRIRHLPMIDSEEEYIRQEAERQAVNSPVQGFASDLGVMAMARLARDVDPRFLRPVAFVHDAIYCFVPEEYAEWGAKTLKWYMESTPLEEWFGLRMRVPILADVSLGRNLGDMYEMGEVDMDRDYDFAQLWDEEKQTGLQVVQQAWPENNGRLEVPEPIFPVDRQPVARVGRVAARGRQ